jgi:hypothetical protein
MPYSTNSAVRHNRRPETRKMIQITPPGTKACSDLRGICFGGPVTVYDAKTMKIKCIERATYWHEFENIKKKKGGKSK